MTKRYGSIIGCICTTLLLAGTVMAADKNVIGSDFCPENMQAQKGYSWKELDVNWWCKWKRRPNATYNERTNWWMCGKNYSVRYGIACRDQYGRDNHVDDYCFKKNEKNKKDRRKVFCEIKPR